MTTSSQRQAKPLHLVWVYPVPVATALDSATWLQTTHVLRTLGWQVTLVAKGPTGQHTINGVQVTCVSTPAKYLLNNVMFHLWVLLLILRGWRTIDVVLFHQLSAPWFLPLRLVRLLSSRQRPQFVMDTRDLNTVEGGLKNRIRRVYFDLTHALANRWADGQTAITERMAELVRIPAAKRWGYWPSGVSLERFAGAHTGRRWPTAAEPVHLMYVGKLHSERNLLPICRAVDEANQRGMHFVLTFVGAGPEQAILEACAAQSEGRICVLPAVSHEQIPQLLRNAHVGITSLPAPDDAKFEASSPIKLFEYMAAGIPMLATSNGCHTDVVGAGRYAFWVHEVSPDGILRALTEINDAKLTLAERGEEARHAVLAWTWSAAGAQLDGALRAGLRGALAPA